jgi:PPK2 family polyphosphate:nucleotide phosphotransferase
MHKNDIKHLRFQAQHSLDKLPTLPEALMHLSAKECLTLTSELGERLNKQQNLMHACGARGLLVVLQGMDTAGKDGVIRHVFQHVSPLGVRAEAFGAPSEQEKKHDFLWRVHQKTPSRGEMVIFNRSHYEDVLVTRVRRWIDLDTCKKRYADIGHFEKMLHDEGIHVVKFFLNISNKEQRLRLQSRLDDPHKRWKLQPSDFEDRKLWPDYMRAYQDALTHTDSDACPWYVIPADSKPHRDVLIGQVLVQTLEAMKLTPPESAWDFSNIELN